MAKDTENETATPTARPAAGPAAGHGAAPTNEPPAAPERSTDYVVFEVVERDDKGEPTMLKRVARVRADNQKEARWAAADADESVRARTLAEAEGEPPLLLPIADRLVKPQATREKALRV